TTEAGKRLLERRGVTVPASLAIELELPALTGAVILIVVSEEDHSSHVAPLVPGSAPGSPAEARYQDGSRRTILLRSNRTQWDTSELCAEVRAPRVLAGVGLRCAREEPHEQQRHRYHRARRAGSGGGFTGDLCLYSARRHLVDKQHRVLVLAARRDQH